jgi:hypothetical protein
MGIGTAGVRGVNVVMMVGVVAWLISLFIRDCP